MGPSVGNAYRRAPGAALSTSRGEPAPAMPRPVAEASAGITGPDVPCSQRTAPVAGSSALTDPGKPAPAIVVLPPAKYSDVPSNVPDDTLASPQVGHVPPYAISRSQTGPPPARCRPEGCA